MRSRQLTFVFADSPQGGKGASPTDASAGKAFLLHRAKGKPTSDLSAPAAETERLLEQAASTSNLATALCPVVQRHLDSLIHMTPRPVMTPIHNSS